MIVYCLIFLNFPQHTTLVEIMQVESRCSPCIVWCTAFYVHTQQNAGPLHNFSVILRNYFKLSFEKNYTLWFFNLGISTMIFILPVASFSNILCFDSFVTIMYFYSLSTLFRALGRIDISMELVLSCIHTSVLSK